MTAERLEVRLDTERRRRLEQIAAEHGLTASEAVRQMIDRAYAESRKTARLRAAREISRLAVEDVPDAQTVSRQLAETYACPDLP